jgi:hypothetical protein
MGAGDSPVQVLEKPFAWSWTQLENFENCPRRWWLETWTKRVPYVQNDAARWGDVCHKALDKRLGPDKIPLPANVKHLEAFALPVEVAEASGCKLVTEQKLAVTEGWAPTTYFAKDTWCRAQTDWTLERGDKIVIGDWKTGKPKEGSDQLRLAAALALAHRPHIQEARISFVWIGENRAEPTSARITRDELPAVRASFLPRIKRMTDAVEADHFPPKPSGLCGWCSVGPKNCEHWQGNNGRRR